MKADREISMENMPGDVLHYIKRIIEKLRRYNETENDKFLKSHI